MTGILTQPEGFEWCGDCASPTRSLSEEDMAALMSEAAQLVAEGYVVREVFRALSWYGEMHTRSRVLCQCPPPPPPALWDGAPSAGFYLYRLWGAEGRLLYVGVSTRLRDRLKAHRRRWGDLIVSVTWEEHVDERSMLTAELEAIRNEDPALNRAGVG